MNVLAELRGRFRSALESFTGDPAMYVAMVKRAQDSRFGDFQANCAMPLAKQRKTNPRDLAAQIIAKLDVADLCHEPEKAGPGFINLRLRDDWLRAQTNRLVSDERLGVSLTGVARRYVIDYSAPNVAKPMHVGHLRSTVIGAALCRMLEFLGHRVVGDNHIGDWGTQFGMIIFGYKHFLDREAYQRNAVGELSRLYRLVNQLCDNDPAIAAAARNETAKLHAGDEENRRLWQQFLPVCLAALQEMYDRLEIRFELSLGESFYQSMLFHVVEDLQSRGIARESDGAICVFLEGNEAPFIIRKGDGAFTYATTDLATIKYRVEELGADEMLYVVDARQSEHFKLLFETARRWGFDTTGYRHISFGTILGDDKRPFKTRSGDTVGLESLLDEAVGRARKIVDANDDAKPNGPELDEATRAAVADAVGIGGIKYADLRHNRDSDYVFSFEKMLAKTGDTATYMQYSYARICGIFRKGRVDPVALRTSGAEIQLTQPEERSLALQLNRFSEELESAARECRPNLLTQYLFDTANCFTTFYERCPVLKEKDEAIRTSRLLLCDLTARMLAQGLSLMGIRTCEQM